MGSRQALTHRTFYTPRETGSSYPESSRSSDDELTQVDSSSNGGGTEVIARNSSSGGQPSNRMVRSNYREDGVDEALLSVGEVIANKLLPPSQSALMLKGFEKRADERIRRTYVEGVPMKEVDDNAVVPRIGITFLPGADKPQVVKQEQIGMSGQEPDQIEALWRVNTAATLLMEFTISPDLSIVETFHTNQAHMVVQRVRSRLNKRQPGEQDPRTSSEFWTETDSNSMSSPTGALSRLSLSSSSTSTRMSLSPPTRSFSSSKQDRVTIDSHYVHIVNDLSQQTWDLESTLIEVDGMSIMKLMVNFRHLISRGGPDMSSEETAQLLDTMIEDARRLCIRSPVLFRMSTRAKIINSTDTRYGINHGSMFRTLTTSQGIREIISLSASYFNSLDPDSDKDTTQKRIRPRFLQMLVLLISLLNNQDLAEIADFLQSTYQFNAERKHLELLFLKVIPLQSINSKVFLHSLIPAVDGEALVGIYQYNPVEQEVHAHVFDVFVQRILGEGYLLPGTVTDLNREEKSWIVTWPEGGFKSTSVFNNLQYNGPLKCINSISAIDFHPESTLSELKTQMTNGNIYTIGASDLEKITCLTPGTYSVQETNEMTRNFDLIIVEHPLNRELYEAIHSINVVIGILNSISTWNAKGKGLKGLFKAQVSKITFLPEVRGSGRLTRSTASLKKDTLAIAYKVEGRKIGRRDAIRNLTHDLQEVEQTLTLIERRLQEIGGQDANREILRGHLDQIGREVRFCEATKKKIADSRDISDEPIAKVLYPGGLGPTGNQVWNDYKAWYTDGDHRLQLEGQRSRVTSVTWSSDIDCVVTLEGRAVRFALSALAPVDEAVRDDEINVDDIAILAGQYLIVAEEEDVGYGDQYGGVNGGGNGKVLSMLNYLRVVGVEEQNSSRRRMNRPKGKSTQALSLFR